MADTYLWYVSQQVLGNGKNQLALLNGAGSGKVVRVYRVGLINAQTAAVTGVLTTQALKTISALSGHTVVAAIKHDSNNAAVDANIIAGYGGTPTEVDLLRRIAWSSDEPAVGGATADELQNIVPLNIIWDAGYGDSNVQPITLREGQGIMVKCETNTVAGVLDVWFEGTIAAT
jgi:hypothetical protein